MHSNTKYIVIIFCLIINQAVGQINISKDSVEAIMKSKHLPGLFISIVEHDTTKHYTFGYADIDSNIKLTETHSQKIGSVTKSFTALAILKLVDQGYLNLDTEIKEAFPEIPIHNPYYKNHPIRLHHLLEHKAGFDDMHFSAFQNKLNRVANADEELQAHKKSLTSRWKPGLVHSYSNSGYVVLGYIVEKVSKKPYAQFVRDHFIEPLNMKNTFFHEDQKSTSRLANGYYYKDGYKDVEDFKLMGQAAGGLWSNGRDLTKLINLYLDKGVVNGDTLLHPKYFEEMESLHGWVEEKNNIISGYGLGLYKRHIGGENKIPFWGHSGGILGYGADFIYNRKLQLGIAVGNNGQRGNKEILNLLVDQLIDYEKYQEDTQQHQADITKFDKWAGTYLMKNSRNQLFRFIDIITSSLSISEENDSIFLTPFLSEKGELSYHKENAFALSGEQESSVYFVKINGEHVIYYDNDLYEKINASLLWSIRVIIVLGILIAVIMVLFFLIQVFKLPFKKFSQVPFKKYFFLGLPHLLILLFFYLFLSLIPLENIIDAGSLNTKTILVFIVSLAIPIITLFNIYYFIYKRTKASTNNIIVWLSLLANIVLLSYMLYFNLIGLALWSY